MLLGKLLMRLWCVGTHADNVCACILEYFVAITEGASLGGATRGIILWIKVQNDIPFA